MAGVTTYLWKESDTRQVYFFERGNQLYGEYRAEALDKNGRIEECTEYYLVNWQNRGRPQDDTDDLPFTRKTERFDWDKSFCTGSTVERQHTWRSKADGTLLKSTPAQTIKMVRRLVTIEVPAELRPNQEARYFIEAMRPPADFERDFLHVDGGGVGMFATLDGDILERASRPLKEGTLTATLEWPADAPAFWLKLNESVRNPPTYQLAYRSTIKATMNLKAPPANDKAIVFQQ